MNNSIVFGIVVAIAIVVIYYYYTQQKPAAVVTPNVLAQEVPKVISAPAQVVNAITTPVVSAPVNDSIIAPTPVLQIAVAPVTESTPAITQPVLESSPVTNDIVAPGLVAVQEVPVALYNDGVPDLNTRRTLTMQRDVTMTNSLFVDLLRDMVFTANLSDGRATFLASSALNQYSTPMMFGSMFARDANTLGFEVVSISQNKMLVFDVPINESINFTRRSGLEWVAVTPISANIYAIGIVDSDGYLWFGTIDIVEQIAVIPFAKSSGYGSSIALDYSNGFVYILVANNEGDVYKRTWNLAKNTFNDWTLLTGNNFARRMFTRIEFLYENSLLKAKMYGKDNIHVVRFDSGRDNSLLPLTDSTELVFARNLAGTFTRDQQNRSAKIYGGALGELILTNPRA